VASSIQRCLIIDDDESFRTLITRYLNLILPDTVVEEYDPSVGGAPPLDFDWSGCDLVILDYFLNASVTGLDLLSEWKKQENFPPVIMMTAAGSEDVAVRAMKSGVQDYLRKQNITREKLRQAIEDAVRYREQERERRMANTQSSQSFNKALFYKKLEQPAEASEPEPVFYLIELDRFTELGDSHGITVQDNLLRHIARFTYDLYSDPKHHAAITRMSDSTVALLFTPQTGLSLEHELKTLSEKLAADVYEHNGELIPYTVSIGAVRIAEVDHSANNIIRSARSACKTVSQRGGNDFAVYEPGQPEARIGEKPAARPPGKPQEAPAAPVRDESEPADENHPQPDSTAPSSVREQTGGKPSQAATSATKTTAAPPKIVPDKPVRQQEKEKDRQKEQQPGSQSTAASHRTPAPAASKPATKSPAVEPAEEQKSPPSEEDLLEMTLELPAEKLRDTKAADIGKTSDIDIMQAFGDNRILQYYQPVMPLSETAAALGKEYYSIRVRMVDTNGEIINAEQIVEDLKNARNQKLLDRWMLRQTIGRIVSHGQGDQAIPEFIIKLSEESFADASLFQWLQNKLMKRIGNAEPGKSIIVEVTADTYLSRERQVDALFKFLRQSYGFRFALSSFREIEQLNQCIGKGKFNLYKIPQEVLAEIQSKQSDPTAMPEQVQQLRQKGTLVAATFIENAAMLTQAINCGADFAMGYFIGEPVDNIGEMSQIESFEIT